MSTEQLNYAALQAELVIDPEELGYDEFISIGADGNIAELLNTPAYPVIGKIEIASLQAWMMNEPIADASGRSIWQAMQDAAASTGPESKAAKEALDMMGSRLSTVDLSKPRPMALLQQYADVGIITAEQKAMILAFATQLKSRAEILFGQAISHLDVAKALRGE